MSSHPDRRSSPLPGVLAPTVSEPGYWECYVDHVWVLYTWPTQSILEQAFCQHLASVEFTERGLLYRVEFEGQVDSEQHAAVQVNVRSSVSRKVRRWPSLWHRSNRLLKESQAEQVAWGAWTQSDFAWSLLDPQEFSAASAGARNPVSATPTRREYGLGAICRFSDACWPKLLQTWSSAASTAAEHPLGSRCNFALQSLFSSMNMSQEGPLRQELELLNQIWQTGGLAGKCEFVGAYRIQNRGLIHSFTALREAMLTRLSCEDFDDGVGRESNLDVRLLWHGSRSVSGLLEICSDGFDRAHAQTCMFGKGCYFASSAAYSDRYACSVKVPGAPQRNLRAMLLAAVLVGEVVQGSSGMYPPPVKPHSRNGERFENACDNVGHPNIFVTFKDAQALPIYVMIYESKTL